jgi:hypothetical protein
MTAPAALDPVNATRRHSVRRIGREAVINVGLFAYLALVLADLEPVDRPLTTDSWWIFAVPATMWGARLASDHRRGGPWVMLAWGAATAFGFVATFLGLLVLVQTIAPQVRAQAGLQAVLVGLAITWALVALVRRIRRESTTVARSIALGEDLALCAIPVGIWLAAQGESMIVVGGSIAIAAPLVLLWLLGQRRTRGLALD